MYSAKAKIYLRTVLKMKKTRKYLYVALLSLVLFILWTIALCFIDIKAIGPDGSRVGFATLNSFARDLIGSNMTLYVITDWLGLVPLFCALGFAVVGLVQWIGRKNILKVDADILILGCFYIAVIAVFILFENIIINRRPVLINGILEASYPSSTTLLVMCVMPTTVLQLNSRIKKAKTRRIITPLLVAFNALMVLGRLASGVHWVTDIVGAALLSVGLVMMYYYLISIISIYKTKEEQHEKRNHSCRQYAG